MRIVDEANTVSTARLLWKLLDKVAEGFFLTIGAVLALWLFGLLS